MALKQINHRIAVLDHKIGAQQARVKVDNSRIKHFRHRSRHAHNHAEHLEDVLREKEQASAITTHNVQEMEEEIARSHHRAVKAHDRLEWWLDDRHTRLRKREYLEELLDDRRRDKRQWLKTHKPNVTVAPNGLEVFDGKYVALGFTYWLQKARDNGWDGYVVSGWRDPIYSESLCLAMCHQITCPGRCAGRGSNHSKATLAAGGAVDVSDYYTFGAIMRDLGSPLHNSLGAADPVHFSISGN